MRRWVGRTIIGTSLLLCLLTAGWWARSHARWDTIAWRYWTSETPDDRWVRSHLLLLTTENGRLIAARALHPSPVQVEQKRLSWTSRGAKAAGTFSESGALPGRYGFGHQTFGQLYRDVTMAPFWFFVVVTGMLPALSLWRVVRRRATDKGTRASRAHVPAQREAKHGDTEARRAA